MLKHIKKSKADGTVVRHARLKEVFGLKIWQKVPHGLLIARGIAGLQIELQEHECEGGSVSYALS